jgi:subtilisin family serine protease
LAADSDVGLIEWQGEQVLAIRDQYIVRVSESVGREALSGVPVGWSSRALGYGIHQLATPGASIQDVSAWAAAAGVAEIAPEAALGKASVVPSDTYYATYQWGLQNTGTPATATSPEGRNFPRTRDADIDMPEAWNFRPTAPLTGTKQIVVAVLDDGIDYRHPDLQANIWDRDAPSVPQQALVNGVMTPVSQVTQRFGYDSSDDSPDDRERAVPRGMGVEGYTTLPWAYGTSVGINNSHGTHIAGIIGATGGNRAGVVGVNWSVSLYAAKIFGDDGRYAGSAALLDAVERIVTLKRFFNQNFVVANASFYQYGDPDPAMIAAVNLLAANDILLVAAAGNGRHVPCAVPTDGVGDKTTAPEQCVDQAVFPANLVGAPVDNVISVAASTARDTLARFSNWGPDVDIAAPGENIWSTVPRSATPTGTYLMHESVDRPGDWRTPYRREPSRMVQGNVGRIVGGYASMSGTSMSAAYVSGVAAFVSAHYLRITNTIPSVTFLRDSILNGADSVSTLTYTEQSGAPRDGNPGYHPDDMFAPFPVGAGNISDPFPNRVHSVAGDRRLNAFGAVRWAYDNLPPKITVTGRTEPRVTEGDPGVPRQVFFRYDLDKPTDAPVTVSYWTEDIPGQAVGGVDYVPISQAAPSSFTIPAGVLRGTFAIDVVPDLIPEPNEGFRVRLALPPNNEAYLAANFASGLIFDDDGTSALPVATLDTPWITVTEGNGGSARPTIVYVPVTIDPAPVRNVLVDYRIAPLQASVTAPDGTLVEPAASGVDFVSLAGTISVPRGTTSTRIPVRIIGDGWGNDGTTEFANEGFVVQIREVRPGKIKDWRATTTVIITNDDETTVNPGPNDPPGVQVEAVTASVFEGDLATFRILSTFAVPSGWTMTVFHQTVSGSAVAGRDFQAIASGRVVVGAGQTEGSFSIRTNLDRSVEPDETFSVRIRNVVYQEIRSGRRLVVPVLAGEAFATIVDAASAVSTGTRLAMFAAAGAQAEESWKKGSR